MLLLSMLRLRGAAGGSADAAQFDDSMATFPGARFDGSATPV
jgi:hypothetical protein